MAISMKARIEEKGLTPRKYKKAIKEANLESAQGLGEHFHEHNLPRRFTYGGGRMLGFAARNPKYNKAKQRKYGHRDPLVWSGFTKRQVLTYEDIRPSGTSNTWRVAVVLRARHLNRFKSPRIRPAEEIQRTADREHGPLTRVFDQLLDAKLDQIDR